MMPSRRRPRITGGRGFPGLSGGASKAHAVRGPAYGRSKMNVVIFNDMEALESGGDPATTVVLHVAVVA